jgi:hypothetical protein
MSVLTPSCFRNIRIVASAVKAAAVDWRPVVPVPGAQMPYTAAAKAIFIRANGEEAYYRATGLLRVANDPKAVF